MSVGRIIRNLALTGFMGCGKSTVGRMVAAQMRFEFVDTDALVEARAGQSIPEIFARSGESAFRELERQAVLELAARSQSVISTGGGLVLNPANLVSLKEHALVVCLWATPETIWERVRHSTHRPLLQDPDPFGKIRQLLTEREPIYRQADVLIQTELRSMREVAQHVVQQYRLAVLRPAHEPHRE